MTAIFLFESLLLALGIGLAFLWGIDLRDQVAFTADAILLGLGAAIFSNLILTPLALRPGAAWISDLRQRTERLLKRIFGDTPGTGAMLAVSYAGVAEELLFRGVLISKLSSYMPVPLAVVIAGVIFGLLHPVTRAYALLAALLGIFWGALYVWSGNLLVPMIAHAASNAIVLAFYMRMWRR